MIINIHERREVNKCSAQPKVRLARGGGGQGDRGRGNVTWWRDEERVARPGCTWSEGAELSPEPPTTFPCLRSGALSGNGWTRPATGLS